MTFNTWYQGTHANHGTMKASMSEMLGLYALLRHFADTRVAAQTQIADEVYLFGLTCKALDLILAAKKDEWMFARQVANCCWSWGNTCRILSGSMGISMLFQKAILGL